MLKFAYTPIRRISTNSRITASLRAQKLKKKVNSSNIENLKKINQISEGTENNKLSTEVIETTLVQNPTATVNRNIDGVDIGFIAEEDGKLSQSVVRQVMRTRRQFKATVLDANGNVVLKILRPVKWLINSRITILNELDEEIGEVTQVWHPWRRKYDLFIKKKQFAEVDGDFLTWDFSVKNEDNKQISLINRDFMGFIKDQRAVILACAIDVDIDYFSRHSSHTTPIIPFGASVPMGGGSGEVAPTPPVDGTGVGTGGFPSAGSNSTSTPGAGNKWGDEEFTPDQGFTADEGFTPDEKSTEDFMSNASENSEGFFSAIGDIIKKISDFFND
ncbi:hypothetical protein HK099_001016 [Clydaea vesicula]|uniref:Phospholipid scramblase n=1 Tax=Clydaea vesicula TaxID=447962 RepID=A0AAD5TW13_9FUNG|nr:hypothetical protein HK099_001016 [Clydaea vesicula]